MPLEKLYYITEICVGIAFVISILFLAMQIRQNSTLLRHSMSLTRRSNESWLMTTICTNDDFRKVHSRILSDYENFSADEKYRADALATQMLTSNLNELMAYKRGLITNDEWISLSQILEFTAARPNIQAVYERVKDQFPQDVRDFWEALPKQSIRAQPMLVRVAGFSTTNNKIDLRPQYATDGKRAFVSINAMRINFQRKLLVSEDGRLRG